MNLFVCVWIGRKSFHIAESLLCRSTNFFFSFSISSFAVSFVVAISAMRLMCHCRSIDHFGFSHRNPWKYSIQAVYSRPSAHNFLSLWIRFICLGIAALAPNKRTRELTMKSSLCSSSSSSNNKQTKCQTILQRFYFIAVYFMNLAINNKTNFGCIEAAVLVVAIIVSMNIFGGLRSVAYFTFSKNSFSRAIHKSHRIVN